MLRSVRAVARDHNWATPQWTISGVADVPGGIRMSLRTRQLGADLDASLTATADGETLTVVFEATSAVEFPTNRTGLVVLHPPQLAGSALRIEHADGTEDTTAFPVDIAPLQPAFDIRSLVWEQEGLRVTCAFDGDVFEMEDQRNWTDASFKTYSRPLALPFPYLLAAGETVRQSVSVTAEAVPDVAVPDAVAGTAAATSGDAQAASAGAVATAAGAEALAFVDAGTMPAVSVGASTAPGAGPVPAPVGADLLVELDLGWAGWPAALARAADSGLPLDVRLVLPEARRRDRGARRRPRSRRPRDRSRNTRSGPRGTMRSTCRTPAPSRCSAPR